MRLTLSQVNFIETSSVTARRYRHRTTIPSEIFKRMELKDKDPLRWIMLKDGTVIIQKASREAPPLNP